MKILIAYDGTLHAKTSLRYGIKKAGEAGGEVIVLQVFDRSVFIDYDAGSKAEDMARAEAARHLEDAKKIISETGAGVNVQLFSTEGDFEREVLRLSETEHADIILAPPRYRALMEKAPCPVYIIPGVILAPVDNTRTLPAGMDKIVLEAKSTGSKVMLLGIVPVNIYSREEKMELEKVRKETVSAVKKLKKALAEQGVDADERVRSGYPDEEILKAADEYSASLIFLPSGGKTPSELAKAAAIILDEPGRLKRPVFLLPAEGTA